MGSNEFILKSGRTQDVRFQVNALEGASYDTTYEIGIQITSGDEINLTGTIIVQVQEWHNLGVTLPNIEVTPGENETIKYWVTNSGNLLESKILFSNSENELVALIELVLYAIV